MSARKSGSQPRRPSARRASTPASAGAVGAGDDGVKKAATKPNRKRVSARRGKGGSASSPPETDTAGEPVAETPAAKVQRSRARRQAVAPPQPAPEPQAQQDDGPQPPAEEPPAPKPPAREPPARKPPVREPEQEPPAEDPSAPEPPAKEPPKRRPPAEEPPKPEPPAKEPPSQEPPPAEVAKPVPAPSPAGARSAAADSPAGAARAEVPSLADLDAATSAARPRLGQSSPRPSVEPPGVQISEDDWETIADAPPEVGQSLRGSSAPGSALASKNGAAGHAEPARSRARTGGTGRGHLTAHSQVAGPRQRDALGSARAVLGADYYYEQWGRQGLRRLEVDVDDFGLDPHFEARMRPWIEAVCRHYFRVELQGVENLPADGRALLVANRSGIVPWDGLVLKEALRKAAPDAPALRWLAEDSVFYYPFLGVFMNRVGAVRACPENAERLFAQSTLVAAFPEGARGAGKLYRERYQLQRFGRGGYVRLALRNQVPVVPVAIVGGEDAYPMLGRSKVLGRLLGARYAPVTPTFPLLGPVGLLPAPAKWRIAIGEPLTLDSYGAAAATDSLLVHRLNDQVRGNLQGLLDQCVQRRGRAWV